MLNKTICGAKIQTLNIVAKFLQLKIQFFIVMFYILNNNNLNNNLNIAIQTGELWFKV